MSKETLYGLCLVSLALQTIAISTNAWSAKSAKTGSVDGSLEVGLWKACGTATKDLFEVDGCVHLPPNKADWFPKNSLYAVRTLALLGIVSLFVALLLMMYKKNPVSRMVLLMLSFLCNLVALIVWGAEFLKLGNKSMKVKLNPGYSWYLELAGTLMSLILICTYYKKCKGNLTPKY